MSGQTIELYIDDSGIKSAEIYEKNIKAYFGKRVIYKELRKYSVKNSIYILLNDSCENSEKKIYIGKTTNACARLKFHARKKDWWTDFIVFTSDKFEPTHLDYLEQKLCKIAEKNSIETTVENKQAPQMGCSVRKIKMEQSENYFRDMIFVLKNLNIVTLITQEDKKNEVTENNKYSKKSFNPDEIFYINLPSEKNEERNAMLSISEEGYILLKGSYIKLECCPSLKENSSPYKNRKILLDRNLIKKVGSYYQVQEDITYSSSSLPAGVVTARQSNGRVEWKLEDGRTIADIESGGGKALSKFLQ